MTGKIAADDRWEIQDAINQYTLATDTGDIDLFVNAFAPDAVLVSSDDARIEGHAAIRKHIEHELSAPNMRGRQHHFSSVKWTREGDDVRVFSYWIVAFRDGKTNALSVRSMGSTDDLCSKTQEGWKIQQRTIRRWNSEIAPWFLKSR